MVRGRRIRGLALGGAAAIGLVASAASAGADGGGPPGRDSMAIKHLVVIFDENVSFDHYFGTYPYASNPPGDAGLQRRVRARPTVNGLYNQQTAPAARPGPLLTSNGNLSNPVLLDRERRLDLRPGSWLHRGAAGRRPRGRGPCTRPYTGQRR